MHCMRSITFMRFESCTHCMRCTHAQWHALYAYVSRVTAVVCNTECAVRMLCTVYAVCTVYALGVVCTVCALCTLGAPISCSLCLCSVVCDGHESAGPVDTSAAAQGGEGLAAGCRGGAGEE